MLKKIYEELVAIRKELQTIRSSLEPRFEINSRGMMRTITRLNERKVDLTNVKTSDLTMELMGREGITASWVNPHEHETVGADGPAQVFIVKD